MIFKNKTEALLDSKSKVYIISQAFILQLGLKIQKTNIKVQIIDDITLKTYKIVLLTFFVLDKDDRKRFFE